MKMNQTINMSPRFRVLSEDQIEQIYFAALDVLETCGGRIIHEEALDRFRKSEAVITDKNLVRIPTSLVERALRSYPRKITLMGRNGQRSVKLQKDEVAFGTGSDTPFVYDRKTGERRRSTFDDVAAAARIVDYLPNFDFFMSHGLVSDVPNPKTYDRHQFLAMIMNNTKPMVVTSVDGEGLKDQWEMACLIRGNEEEFRLNPLFVIYIEPVSPLTNSKEAIEKLVFAAEKGIPAMYTPCLSAGGTAPATIAGMLVQSVAEVLMAAVLCYLIKPGMPLIMGGVQTVMDMRTSIYSYGAPELSLASAASTDISKWLGLLMFSTGGCSDSKVVDEQAAVESAMSLYNAFLSGANFVHDVGYLDSGLNGSLPSLVMCDEIIGMIRQIGKGIRVDDETLALDVLNEVGPGGEFVSHDHTFNHWKEWYRPTFIDRSNYETWVTTGKKTFNDRIEEQVDHILETYEAEPLDENVLKEMKKIIDLADKRHS